MGDRKFRQGLGWVRWATTLTVLSQSILSQSILTPAFGAERIFLNYALFGRSVSIRALEVFAREGKLTGELVSYSRFIKPQQLALLRGGLLQKIEFSPIALSQFLYSSTGRIILGRGSQVIQTSAGRGSFYALRSALILAAGDPEGFTPLSVLKHYPNPGILVNVEEIIGIANESNLIFKKTAEFVEASQSRGGVQPLTNEDIRRLQQWQNAGSFDSDIIPIDLIDSSEKRLRYTRRPRKVVADIYLPRTNQPRPVVVISHGLNSDRQSYAYLAKHLASYGFVVVVPEHPGSNKQQIQSLLEGRGGDVTQPMEFVNRPLDVQFLLDTLQGLAQSDPRFQGKLDLDKVGVMGQSFGGYTSLALAGAPLNIPLLRQSCGQELIKTLNISLVLQCQALSVPAEPYALADPRVKAAIAINPITSAVFGPTSLAQIQIPTMIIAGSDDVIAPALLEQIQPFATLTTPQRYLVMIQNSNHFSTIASVQGPSSDSVPQIKGLEGPSPEVAQTYLKVLSLVFMQTYLNEQQDNQRYLSPAGAAALNQAVLPLSIVQTLPTQNTP